MQKFVAIIGNPNSGKSTVIRSLTGCPNSTFRDVMNDITTGESIYVMCSSPQERPLTLQELRKVLKACTANRKCRGLVMAIQPTSPTKRLSIETIFQEVDVSGAFQSYVFVLSPGGSGGSPNGASIGARLKPLKLKPIALDGGRFALVNAQLINKRTRIVG